MFMFQILNFSILSHAVHLYTLTLPIPLALHISTSSHLIP